MNAITVENLAVAYQSAWAQKQITILQGVSFSVGAGEAVGYIGQNGAGKTSTIKCLLDLVRAKSGLISLFGISSHEKQSRALLGYLPEQPYWYENLTIAETIYFYGALFGLSKQEVLKRAGYLLEKFNLDSRLDHKIKSLSKGLMQRVGLIQALINNPKLLILDEPFSGLDPIGRKEFRDIFLEQKQKGTTIFISSHILSDVERLCDRALIIHKKTLARDVHIKELRSSLSQHHEVIIVKSEAFLTADWAKDFLPYVVHQDQEQIALSFDSYSSAEHCVHMCIHQQIPILTFQPHPLSLEDIFNEVVQS